MRCPGSGFEIAAERERRSEEVGRWYATLEKDRRTPSREVRTKANELTKDFTADLDKTQALYDFVAKNFRYVSLSLGLGRYQPHSASDVLHNQYGDCKDKHTLLASMLGVFIARTLLERTGAKVSFSNRTFPDHGAVVQIVWPRDRFETSEPLDESTA